MTLEEANYEKVKELSKNKKMWLPKRIFLWFLSLAKKLIDIKGQKISEVIVNWILIIAPIALLISYSLAKKYTTNAEEDNITEAFLETLGTYGFVALMSIVFWFSALTYKLVLKVQKKKGIYWSRRHAENRGWL